MHLTTTLFTTSFTIVVAAGLAQLDAGPEADGPTGKPALHAATIGGRHLEVSLDRERVPAGEAVHLTIRATDGGPAGETVRVALLEQTGSPASRMPSPPRQVSQKDVQVGSEPVAVALTLSGPTTAAGNKAGDPLIVAGRATQYTLVVTGAGAAKDHGPIADDAGLYLPVFAYQPEAYRLTIEPPAAGAPGDTVDVAVRVTSLAGKPLRGITIGLSSELVAIDDQARIDVLAPKAETVVHLHGQRQAVGADPVRMQAYGTAEYGGSAGAWATIDGAHGTLIARASEPDPMMLAILGGF